MNRQLKGRVSTTEDHYTTSVVILQRAHLEHKSVFLNQPTFKGALRRRGSLIKTCMRGVNFEELSVIEERGPRSRRTISSLKDLPALNVKLPLAPAFGVLRLASPRDSLRIGIVAACGFHCSPVLDWERPYHERYPKDTLMSFHQEFANTIKGDEHVVLVAEPSTIRTRPRDQKLSRALKEQESRQKYQACGCFSSKSARGKSTLYILFKVHVDC
jgi:hypothetical protein